MSNEQGYTSLDDLPEGQRVGRVYLKFVFWLLRVPKKRGEYLFDADVQQRLRAWCLYFEHSWLLVPWRGLRRVYQELRDRRVLFHSREFKKRIRVFFFPGLKQSVPNSTYKVPVYLQPFWKPRFKDPRINHSFVRYARYFYSNDFYLKVLGPSRVEPVRGRYFPEAKGSTSRPLLKVVCLLREPELPFVEDELNYYHFHFDLLGKLLTLDDCGVDQAVPLLVSERVYNSALFQCIKGWGSLKNRQWLSDEGQETIVEKLIVAKLPPISADSIRKMRLLLGAPAAAKTSGRKIYVKRFAPAIRKVLNTDEVTAFLVQRGFEVHDTAALTLEEQKSLFSEARYLVLDHGAALVNLIYRGGAPLSVLEFFPAAKIPPHTWWICQSIGASYDALVGLPPPQSALFKYDAEDYFVEIDKLAAAVESLLQRSGCL